MDHTAPKHTNKAWKRSPLWRCAFIAFVRKKWQHDVRVPSIWLSIFSRHFSLAVRFAVATCRDAIFHHSLELYGKAFFYVEQTGNITILDSYGWILFFLASSLVHISLWIRWISWIHFIFRDCNFHSHSTLKWSFVFFSIPAHSHVSIPLLLRLSFHSVCPWYAFPHTIMCHMGFLWLFQERGAIAESILWWAG